MRRKKFTSIASAVLIGLSVLTAPPAEAQFLKKISKGLEKVNKGLEEVEKAVNQPAKTQSSTSSSTIPKATSSADDSGFKVAEAVTVPYLTSNTLFGHIDYPNVDNISPVYEDAFAIKNNKEEIAFWTVDGRMIFDYNWKAPYEYDSELPRFSSGVAVVKSATRNAAGKDFLALLYRDGRVRELDPSWTYATQFKDGLALVTQEVNYKKKYFYINLLGEKVFPSLSVYGDPKNSMRPLKGGLRAFCSLVGTNKRWGYVDDKGSVVIPPKFISARDFSDGYAWVAEDDGTPYGQGKLALIDTKGNMVLRPDIPVGSSVDSNRAFGDVRQGIFYADKSNKGTIYYDVTGKELSRAQEGSSFNCDGYAFKYVRGGWDSHHYDVIDTDFNTVKALAYHELESHERDMNFDPYGLGSPGYPSNVLTTDGTIVLTGYEPSGSATRISGIQQFTESGYARLKDVVINGTLFVGYVLPSGEVAWLFTNEPLKENYSGVPTQPDPIRRPVIDDPVSPRTPDPAPPIGPKDWTSPTYTVTITCDPLEGGIASVSPSGSFKYGANANVSAGAADGYALAWIQTADGKVITPGKSFSVTSDMALTAKFVKEEKVDQPAGDYKLNGILHATQKSIGVVKNVTVFADISRNSDIKSPYGENTHGYLVVMFDPKEKIVADGISTYVFFAPLKIIGVQHDETDGKDWLVADGGNMVFGNLKVDTWDPFGNLWFKAIMAFDGFSSPDVLPRRYRIEMLDVDKDSGAFTLGTLETYSVKEGRWVPGQHPSLTETTRDMFGTKNDYGFEPGAFAGVRLTPGADLSDKVQWTPPLEWYKNNEDAFSQMLDRMGNIYRNYSSDYEQLFNK